MAKEFTGSWLIVIILILLCWPAALIYFIMKYEEKPQFGPGYYSNPGQPYQQPPQQYQQPAQGNTCPSCGAGFEPGAQFCPKCGNRL